MKSDPNPNPHPNSGHDPSVEVCPLEYKVQKLLTSMTRICCLYNHSHICYTLFFTKDVLLEVLLTTRILSTFLNVTSETKSATQLCWAAMLALVKTSTRSLQTHCKWKLNHIRCVRTLSQNKHTRCLAKQIQSTS